MKKSFEENFEKEVDEMMKMIEKLPLSEQIEMEKMENNMMNRFNSMGGDDGKLYTKEEFRRILVGSIIMENSLTKEEIDDLYNERLIRDN